uniref:Ig-like domain-containing protein n=1 Tax=Schistocephalus solidus TaxID=70667 RepID=A0A183SBC3_SCHSO
LPLLKLMTIHFWEDSNQPVGPSMLPTKSLTEEREGGRHATSLQNIPWEQEYESRQDIHYTVNLNQTGFEGGYLCIASVVGMDAARWSYMHLRVLDCGTEGRAASKPCVLNWGLLVTQAPAGFPFSLPVGNQFETTRMKPVCTSL